MHLPVFIAHVFQLEIVAQHLLYDEEPVEVICSCDGASRHQSVALPRYFGWFGLVVLISVGLEWACIRVPVHLWIGTHIHGALYFWVQIFDVDAELVLIGSSRRVVQVLVELADVGFFFRQFFALKHFSPTHNFHALSRCAKKRHHRLVHSSGLVADVYGLFVCFQTVHLDNHESVIPQSLLLLFEVHAFGCKQNAGQVHGVLLIVNDDLSVVQSLRFQKLVVQSNIEHFVLFRVIAD